MLDPHLVSSQSVLGPTGYVQCVDATKAYDEIPPMVDRHQIMHTPAEHGR